MDKLQKVLKNHFECGLETDDFMTLNDIISGINYKGTKIALSKALIENIIYSRTIKVDRKSTRIYYIRFRNEKKQKKYESRSRFYKPDELKEIISANFMHSETDFLTNMQIGYILNEIKPDLKTNMRRIGRMLNDMGFKPGQKMIKGISHRIYFLKRVAQHNDILEDLF